MGITSGSFDIAQWPVPGIAASPHEQLFIIGGSVIRNSTIAFSIAAFARTPSFNHLVVQANGYQSIFGIESSIDDLFRLRNNFFLGALLKHRGAFRKSRLCPRRVNHCSPPFSNWANQNAISAVIDLLGRHLMCLCCPLLLIRSPSSARPRGGGEAALLLYPRARLVIIRDDARSR